VPRGETEIEKDPVDLFPVERTEPEPARGRIESPFLYVYGKIVIYIQKHAL